MRLRSADNRSHLEIVRGSDDTPPRYAVSCEVDIGHGRFVAHNAEVYFTNLAAFVAELDHFILDRTRSPILDGTYGTYIKVSCSGSSRALVLSFAIGDAYCGAPATIDYRFEGAFPLDQEALNSMVSAFAGLARDA